MIVIWAVALTTIVNFLTSIWTIFSGPSKRNAAALAEQAQTLARLETRLQSVELKQASQPTTEVMHQLELALAGNPGRDEVHGDADGRSASDLRTPGGHGRPPRQPPDEPIAMSDFENSDMRPMRG